MAKGRKEEIGPDLSAKDVAQQAPEASDPEVVIALVPKAYKLRTNEGIVHSIPQGTHRMPRHMAEHWYSKANGVTLFEGAAAKPLVG